MEFIFRIIIFFRPLRHTAKYRLMEERTDVTHVCIYDLRIFVYTRCCFRSCVDELMCNSKIGISLLGNVERA